MSGLGSPDGVLFFPVTPFDAEDEVAHDLLHQHVEERLAAGPGAVFPACGTGEMHALSQEEAVAVAATAVRAVGGRVPVVAGVGGPLGHARALAREHQANGVDALLLLPPYLVAGTPRGTADYVRAVVAACDLPVVVYHRGTARFTAPVMADLAREPQVVGFKDGTGDLAEAQDVVRAVAGTGRDDFLFFNGLLTAELSQAAYRAIGVPLYSSAAFAMAPEVAVAHYEALQRGDEARRVELIDGFYRPLVALRDEAPGFGVSLVKAGLRLGGLPVGSVRAPLADPDEDQTRRLAELLEVGRALAGAPGGSPA